MSVMFPDGCFSERAPSTLSFSTSFQARSGNGKLLRFSIKQHLHHSKLAFITTFRKSLASKRRIVLYYLPFLSVVFLATKLCDNWVVLLAWMMPAKPIDVDRPPGSSLLAELNMQLPNVAMYAFLSLCLTLPAARYCWQKLFDHPSVNQSALRMLMLKSLFVVQTVILGALANDMIFQLAFDRKALPKAAAMWMTPASMV